MSITRFGEPCPLCGEPLLLDVLLLHSAQSGRVEREQVTGRHCHGCELIYRERWSEVMQILYGDN